jgi:N-acetylglucosaminyldiphosphoundecaprenol N-acetyl-beta-D-mannosaminyltransferase
MQKINILGINISTFNKEEIKSTIENYLESNGQYYIVTPGPEFILRAENDEEFFYILNKADLAVPDGFGLKCAAGVMGKNIYRYPGADMVKDILKLAEDKKKRVVVFSWNKSLSKPDEITAAIKSKYPKLEFTVFELSRNKKEWVSIERSSTLKEFAPDIIFVALGAPWQEKFIYHSLKKIPSAQLAVGVGGSFDFFTGKIKRAPKLFRVAGLEWVWRIIKQPWEKKVWRLKRIYHAVIIFPLKFIKWRFINRFFYRKNIACLLYKRKENSYKVLVVERQIETNHWQIPQGGIDNLSPQKAGVKELEEEIGTDRFKPIKFFNFIYSYKYAAEDKVAIAGSGVRPRGHKGQKQGLMIAEFTGNDKDIKINYWDHSAWKWIDYKELVDTVHRKRKEATKIFLKKFEEVIK